MSSGIAEDRYNVVLVLVMGLTVRKAEAEVWRLLRARAALPAIVMFTTLIR